MEVHFTNAAAAPLQPSPKTLKKSQASTSKPTNPGTTKYQSLTIPALFSLRGVLKNKEQRDLWYHAQLLAHKSKPPKGKYAYGSSRHKVVKVAQGWKLGGEILPESTPVYDYGFSTHGERLTVAHGVWVYKHQLPGCDLRCATSIEEKLFSVKQPVFRGSETIDRSRKNKLRVRCGSGYYRIVLVNLKIARHLVYIFGTTIRVDIRIHPVPQWMRRKTIVLPHPARTSCDCVSNPTGFTMEVGRPTGPGMVTIGGIEMKCTKVGPLCTIRFKDKTWYAHPSVVHPIKDKYII